MLEITVEDKVGGEIRAAAGQSRLYVRSSACMTGRFVAGRAPGNRAIGAGLAVLARVFHASLS